MYTMSTKKLIVMEEKPAELQVYELIQSSQDCVCLVQLQCRL